MKTRSIHSLKLENLERMMRGMPNDTPFDPMPPFRSPLHEDMFHKSERLIALIAISENDLADKTYRAEWPIIEQDLRAYKSDLQKLTELFNAVQDDTQVPPIYSKD